MDGQPRYFDVTIRNSLQPSYILKAAIHPGAAAEAAEFEKDARHEAKCYHSRWSILSTSFLISGLHIIFHSRDFKRNMFKDIINRWDTVSSSFQEHIRTVACKAMVLQRQDVTCMYAIRSFRCS